ncbi:MAG: host attachment protein [Alphaproteobacteria bacterium]
MKKIVTWVVIADGQHARIVANDGPGKGLYQVPGGAMEGDARRGRDIVADRPGRSFDSAGQHRHGMEPSSDPRQLVEDAFLHGLLDRLSAAEAEGAFDRLVLVAEPKALGTLRKHMPQALSGRLSGDLAKDLTKTPLDQLGSHLDSILAL